MNAYVCRCAGGWVGECEVGWGAGRRRKEITNERRWEKGEAEGAWRMGLERLSIGSRKRSKNKLVKRNNQQKAERR